MSNVKTYHDIIIYLIVKNKNVHELWSNLLSSTGFRPLAMMELWPERWCPIVSHLTSEQLLLGGYDRYDRVEGVHDWIVVWTLANSLAVDHIWLRLDPVHVQYDLNMIWVDIILIYIDTIWRKSSLFFARTGLDRSDRRKWKVSKGPKNHGHWMSLGAWRPECYSRGLAPNSNGREAAVPCRALPCRAWL